MSNELFALSDRLAALVEEVGRSVVRVEGIRTASGTVWAEDRFVVPSQAVSDEEIIRLFTQGETPREGKLRGSDPATGLALVEAPTAGLVVPRWDDGAGTRVGHLVVAVGRPGASLRATLGMVSGLEGPWRTPGGARLDRWIDVDGELPPGFSGGPLVATGGAVLGMNTRAIVRSGTTVPTATLRAVLTELERTGTLRRAWLGVAVQPVELPESLAATAGQSRGLVVMGVERKSPAAAAGIALGDVLLTLGDTRLAETRLVEVDALLAALHDLRAGSSAAIRFARAGEVREQAVTLGERRSGRRCR